MSRFMRSLAGGLLTVAVATHAYGQGSANSDSYWAKDPSSWTVELRPLVLWMPSMSTRVTLPDEPNRPGGKATSSTDGAYFGGFRLEKNKWSVDGSFLWLEMSGDNPNPKINVGVGTKLVQVLGGREILPGLSLEGGVRGMSLDLSAKILSLPEVSGSKTLWDPLIGMTYHKSLGKKWRLNVHGDGGGFGVGSDVTYALSGTLDWRFLKHFGASFGYGVLHFETSNKFSQRTLVTEPTIYGPVIGLGIYF